MAETIVSANMRSFTTALDGSENAYRSAKPPRSESSGNAGRRNSKFVDFIISSPQSTFSQRANTIDPLLATCQTVQSSHPPCYQLFEHPIELWPEHCH